MTNQIAAHKPGPNPVDLHPLDQEQLELTGSLPAIPLLVSPQILADLAKPPLSLDTIETTDRPLPLAVEQTSQLNVDNSTDLDPDRPDYSYRAFLLRPRMDAYLRAREIYADADGSFSGKLSTRLQNCRRNAWFVQNKHTGKLRVASSRCKLKWCPICRDVSRHIVSIAVSDWLKVQDYPKMLTFTIKHSDDPLQEQIKFLYDSFRKIRRRSILKNAVTGGIWFFQLKFNHATEQWHPHIHCLVGGAYIPQNRLKGVWHDITKQSFIVDIRPVQDLDSAASEVARYATSPCDMCSIDLEHSLGVYHATKHQRICGAWGTARGTTLAPSPQPDQEDWQRVADFYYVSIHRSHIGHLREFWECFRTGTPYTGPEPQAEKDVLRDELDFHLEGKVDPLDHHFRFRRIVETQASFWLNDIDR
ncbi:unnamed protein product, partial [marine sediment metagenome]